MANKMAASFNLRTRITELWRFKAQKVEKLYEDHLAIFRAGLRQMGFLNVAKNGTIFSRNQW